MNEPKERKPSIKKSLIAQTKVRDSSGRFLSGEELQNYQVQQQQIQYANEQAKLASLFGRKPLQANTPTQQNTSFQTQDTNDIERDKWEVLLGKKKSNMRW